MPLKPGTFVERPGDGFHLRWVLTQFVRYYNERRPHRSLGLAAPEGPAEYPLEGQVLCRQVLGALINDYYRKAA